LSVVIIVVGWLLSFIRFAFGLWSFFGWRFTLCSRASAASGTFVLGHRIPLQLRFDFPDGQ
jgi:hypothetical protein